MTLPELVSAVAARMGSRRGIEKEVQEEMQLAIRRLEEGPVKFWFLLGDTRTNVTTEGEGRLPVPGNFLREYEEGALWVNQEDGTRIPLIKRDNTTLARDYPGSGIPVAYSLTGQYFRLYPIPDMEYGMDVLIYQRSPALREDLDNVWFHHGTELLINATCHNMAIRQRDGSAVKLYLAKEMSEYQKLVIDHEARANANYDEVYGETYGY